MWAHLPGDYKFLGIKVSTVDQSCMRVATVAMPCVVARHVAISHSVRQQLRASAAVLHVLCCGCGYTCRRRGALALLFGDVYVCARVGCIGGGH